MAVATLPDYRQYSSCLTRGLFQNKPANRLESANVMCRQSIDGRNMKTNRNRFCFRATALTALITVFPMMPVQAQSTVPQDELELKQMFANIAKDTKWNMTGDMLWGYFFTNPKRDSLDAAAKDLQRMGYRFVDIYLADKKKPSDPDLWWLHVERVETHSVASLHKRNIELKAFAQERHLSSYDGMDVGPAGAIKK